MSQRNVTLFLRASFWWLKPSRVCVAAGEPNCLPGSPTRLKHRRQVRPVTILVKVTRWRLVKCELVCNRGISLLFVLVTVSLAHTHIVRCVPGPCWAPGCLWDYFSGKVRTIMESPNRSSLYRQIDGEIKSFIRFLEVITSCRYYHSHCFTVLREFIRRSFPRS